MTTHRDAIATVQIDPADTELIGLDWAPRLTAQERTAADITGFTVTAPAPLSVVHSARSGAITRAWITGAVAAGSYLVVFRLQLANPAGVGDPIVWERSIRVVARQL
jgi:hypothetical protein